MTEAEPLSHQTDAPATAVDAEFLFVTRKWAPAMGGMETWAVKLAEAVAKQRRLDVIALPGRDDGMPPSVMSLLCFPFAVMLRYFARRSPASAVLLGDMAIWPLALPMMLGRDRPKVLIAAHGTDVSYPRRGGLKGRLYGAYLKIGARILRGAKVIANSQATATAAAETGWRNAAVIPLATDMRSQTSNGSHNGTILFAGRLIPLKGCGWFAREVLPLLPESLRLQIAGTGWSSSEADVVKLSRVEHLGCLSQDDLAQAYAQALCVILPNRDPGTGEFEGFGLVAAEAAAAGGIILAADHGGLREAVIDGVTGTLLPSGNAQAWAAAIVEVAEWDTDQRKNWVEQAQVAAARDFSWERVASSVIALLDATRDTPQ